ncbi:MAG: hypothetical protein PVG39_11085 [Desulfobacteraceae bacterium]|jgi:hypothetical protein
MTFIFLSFKSNFVRTGKHSQPDIPDTIIRERTTVFNRKAVLIYTILILFASSYSAEFNVDSQKSKVSVNETWSLKDSGETLVIKQISNTQWGKRNITICV